MINSNRIDSFDSLSPLDFFEEYVIKSKPVILKENMPCLSKWDLKYILQKISHMDVRYKVSRSHKYPDFSQTETLNYISSTFAQYVEKAFGDNKNYCFLSGDECAFYDLGKVNTAMSELASDYCIPNVIKDVSVKKIGFWVSPKGTRSWLHYDGLGSQNLNLQVKGSKSVDLYSPCLASKLYLYRTAFAEPMNFSQVDIESPDEDKFPKFKEAVK